MRSKSNSFILKCLALGEIKRLSQVNATIKCLPFSASGVSQLTDATLVSRIGVCPPTHSDRQWQQFMSPRSQVRWCWREVDGAWFSMSTENTGFFASKTWQRYRHPTSGRCFWWSSDADWGWESLHGDWHQPREDLQECIRCHLLLLKGPWCQACPQKVLHFQHNPS